MTLLNLVKMRCGIPESITAYDDAEIIPLIEDCIADMKTGGVQNKLLPDSTNAENTDSSLLYNIKRRGLTKKNTSSKFGLLLT